MSWFTETGLFRRVTVIWLLTLALFGWLPLVRVLFDGDTYEWGVRYFGILLNGAGLDGDNWYLVVRTAVCGAAVWAVLRRWRVTGPVLALAITAFLFASDLHALFMAQPMIFHGDTLGIRLNVTAIAPVVTAVALSAAIGLLIQDLRRSATPPPALAKANLRWLAILAAALPLQFVLLRFGEPHGATDAVGVVMTILQVYAFGWALRARD